MKISDTINRIEPPKSYIGLALKWAKWRRSRIPVWAFVLLFTISACAIFAPVVSPGDPSKINLTKRLVPPVWESGGSSEFLLGTDSLGRDLLSRIIHGSRVSMLVGVAAVVLG
ncbi:MAG: ABC transporter permease, partial [Desulfobacteraceae bacterium]|nr:ABC transporter permease [Desulfobacteraceae bacterium]